MKSLKNTMALIIMAGVSFILFSCGDKGPKIDLGNKVSIGIVEIPDNSFCITKTEITQKFYEAVTGTNPSTTKGDNYPVETVSYYDAVVFCNKLSILLGKKPCYTVDSSSNPDDWDYVPHAGKSIEGNIVLDMSADGFRLPTMEEWDIAFQGGGKHIYSGSDDLDSVAWTDCNSGGVLHEVAQLLPNGYGIYDMSGNVFEWVWNEREDKSRYYRGGSYFDAARAGKSTNKELNYASGQFKTVGFRITWNRPIPM